MRVLVVEDDPDALEMLENALICFDYEVATARDGLEAQEMVRSGHYRLIISDWEMPGMTGVELCRYVRQRASSEYTYFILLTLRTGRHNVIDGLRAGADEFLSKPFDPTELEMRLRVAERILSLESRDVVIFSLAKLAEARDTDTGAHLERIREYCLVLAQHLAGMQKFNSVLDGDYIQLLYLTSPLHDIGKVGIPDNVLLKPGRLTPEEFEIMKEHVLIGGRTLDAAVKAHPRAKYLQVARDIAFTHHEKFDGTGYPNHLHGEEIPLCGRIVALSDVYDALTTRRVYKPAYSHEVAKNIIVDGSGKHFDPDIVDAFLASEEEFLAIKDRLDDTDFEAEEAGGPDRAVSAGIIEFAPFDAVEEFVRIPRPSHLGILTTSAT
jgi:putative two-component system response regulator